MIEVFNEAPLAFVAVAFAFALMIGSFLNVVIYRLPIMMQREWRDQCEELQEALPDDLKAIVEKAAMAATFQGYADFWQRSIELMVFSTKSRRGTTGSSLEYSE